MGLHRSDDLSRDRRPINWTAWIQTFIALAAVGYFISLIYGKMTTDPNLRLNGDKEEVSQLPAVPQNFWG